MILRLQEDIQTMEDPKAKVRLGSLVHGYLWALTNKFRFEQSVIGNEIESEIARRQQSGMWVHGVQVPAIPLERISEVASSAPTQLTESTVESQVLRPFDHREQLIERIADSYSAAVSRFLASLWTPLASFPLPQLNPTPLFRNSASTN